MATIASIIKQGKGTAHAWRVEREDERCELWHYSTRMLVWNGENPNDPDVLDYSTGWGSVSDQNGLNTAFRALDLPYRYDRKGGAQIVDLRPQLAERAGYDAGKSAGSWIIDGNTSEEVARRILAGIKDGDPEVLDQLPSAPFSGEWADGIMARDVLLGYGLDEDAPEAEELLTAFEDGYSSGAEDEVARAARAIL